MNLDLRYADKNTMETSMSVLKRALNLYQSKLNSESITHISPFRVQKINESILLLSKHLQSPRALNISMQQSTSGVMEHFFFTDMIEEKEMEEYRDRLFLGIPKEEQHFFHYLKPGYYRIYKNMYIRDNPEGTWDTTVPSIPRLFHQVIMSIDVNELKKESLYAFSELFQCLDNYAQEFHRLGYEGIETRGNDWFNLYARDLKLARMVENDKMTAAEAFSLMFASTCSVTMTQRDRWKENTVDKVLRLGKSKNAQAKTLQSLARYMLDQHSEKNKEVIDLDEMMTIYQQSMDEIPDALVLSMSMVPMAELSHSESTSWKIFNSVINKRFGRIVSFYHVPGLHGDQYVSQANDSDTEIKYWDVQSII